MPPKTWCLPKLLQVGELWPVPVAPAPRCIHSESGSCPRLAPSKSGITSRITAHGGTWAQAAEANHSANLVLTLGVGIHVVVEYPKTVLHQSLQQDVFLHVRLSRSCRDQFLYHLYRSPISISQLHNHCQLYLGKWHMNAWSFNLLSSPPLHLFPAAQQVQSMCRLLHF